MKGESYLRLIDDAVEMMNWFAVIAEEGCKICSGPRASINRVPAAGHGAGS